MKTISLYLAPFIALWWVADCKAETPNVVQIEGFEAAHGAPLNRCLGFIVEKDGFLLTNYQCLTNPASGRLLNEFRVTLAGRAGDPLDAIVIGVEPTLNIGILKIESNKPFVPSISAGEKTVTVGAKLAAVESFKEGKPRLIEGMVAGINTRLCYQENLTSTMFRAKIDLTKESLGGPVFFADSGEVAALYTGYRPAVGQGHAEDLGETHLLPISLCFNIYDSIKQKGSLKSPWTGFSVRSLNEAEQRFFPTAKKHNGGVAIEHVWEGSPAQKLGIRVNDILVQISYNRIVSVADFQKWLYMYGVGQPVKFMILRNGTEYLITDYVIEERPTWAKPR